MSNSLVLGCGKWALRCHAAVARARSELANTGRRKFESIPDGYAEWKQTNCAAVVGAWSGYRIKGLRHGLQYFALLHVLLRISFLVHGIARTLSDINICPFPNQTIGCGYRYLCARGTVPVR